MRKMEGRAGEVGKGVQGEGTREREREAGRNWKEQE